MLFLLVSGDSGEVEVASCWEPMHVLSSDRRQCSVLPRIWGDRKVVAFTADSYHCTLSVGCTLRLNVMHILVVP